MTSDSPVRLDLSTLDQGIRQVQKMRDDFQNLLRVFSECHSSGQNADKTSVPHSANKSEYKSLPGNQSLRSTMKVHLDSLTVSLSKLDHIIASLPPNAAGFPEQLLQIGVSDPEFMRNIIRSRVWSSQSQEAASHLISILQHHTARRNISHIRPRSTLHSFDSRTLEANLSSHLSRQFRELDFKFFTISSNSTVLQLVVPMTMICWLGFRGFLVELVNLRGFDEPLRYDDRLMPVSDSFWQPSNHLVFQQVSKNLRSAALHFLTPPGISIQNFIQFFIIQLLLDKGATIATPHEYFCNCTECSNQREFDSVKYSRTRLNAYRSLASPAYMSLASKDHLITVFNLSGELDNLANIEKEYRSEYLALSHQCRTFGLELFDLCRTTEEVMAVLNGEKEPYIDDSGQLVNPLTTLKLAIKCHQKRFIAHSACQRQLIILWYSGVPWLRHLNSFFVFLLFMICMFFFPVIMLVYVFYPIGRVAKVMRTPFVKFLNHTNAYLIFLFLILLDASMGGNKWVRVACGSMDYTALIPSAIVLVFIFGTLWTEIREVYALGIKDYVRFWWNWMDFAVMALYFAAYILRIVVMTRIRSNPLIAAGYCRRGVPECGQWACYIKTAEALNQTCTLELYEPLADSRVPDPSRMSEILYGLATMISFARVAFVMPASEQLGPLLISFGLMLQDVLRIMVIMGLIFAAFVSGMTSLYSVYTCENHAFITLTESAKSLFWAMFSMADTHAPNLDRGLNAYGLTTTIFVTETNMLLTEVLGYLLFGTYIMANAVVLINMLIAMLSNTFQDVYNDKDVEWKFARAKLWIVYFEDENTLPPPFNLLPNITTIYRSIRRLVRSNLRKETRQQMDEASPKNVTNRLVKRYIHKKQFLDVKEENESDIVAQIKDLSESHHKVAINFEQQLHTVGQSHSREILSTKHEITSLKDMIQNLEKSLSRIKTHKDASSESVLSQVTRDEIIADDAALIAKENVKAQHVPKQPLDKVDDIEVSNESNMDKDDEVNTGAEDIDATGVKDTTKLAEKTDDTSL